MSTPKLSEVRAGYDRWSAVYDHDANPLPALEEPVVRRAAGEVAGLKVVDLGCGTGRHTAWLAAAGARVTAVDFSAGMLAEARRKATGNDVTFIEHDLHQPLPFADGEFALAVSGLVLEHLVDLRAFFRETRRVLRGSGRAVVSGMHPAMFQRSSQARFTDPTSGEVVAPGSVNHSIAEMVMAALDAGLRLDNVSEHAPTAEFAERYPRAAKYVDWPMLVVFSFIRDSGAN
ncbi:MAG: class I SAM-dependent methyltransferase [Pirellulales bacterium]